MMKKSIAFLLPKEKPYAVGGYKVALEYANRLVADGYEVYLVYASTLFFGRHSFIDKCKILAYHLKMKWRRHTRTEKWFHIDPRVRQVRALTPAECFVPRCDVYVATAIQTAIYLNQYKIGSDRKIYLIQDFENWQYNDLQVEATYRYSMRNVVISRWLLKKVEKAGAHATLIPNGFDFDFFHLTSPIESRNPYHIAFMYHVDERKGCDVSMAAFAQVKSHYPQLQINTFSAYPRPADLPEWYHFHHLPDKDMFNQIYNDSAIYVGASRVEGWGLTVGEAMICGCAVACTDNDGYREMAEDGKNALVVPIGDVDRLANAIIRLIEDSNLRIRLAKQGNQDIQRFHWEHSYRMFKKLIKNGGTANITD